MDDNELFEQARRRVQKQIKGRCVTNKDIIVDQEREIEYYREKIKKLTHANNTRNEPTEILEDKIMVITDIYKINNKEYYITYTEETKAKDLFDCLNRILINNNGMVTYKDICITVKEPIIGVVIEEKKRLGSWFI